MVSTVLIILIAIYLLTKMFTTNPLEGKWAGEDGNCSLSVSGNGSVVVTLPEVAEATGVEVKLPYTIDKGDKTFTIKDDPQEIQRLTEKSGGMYTQENLESTLSSITTTFNYSVEQEQLTLTEREYGEQMTFIKE